MDYLSTQNSRKTSVGSWMSCHLGCSGRSLLPFLLLLSMATLLANCTKPTSQQSGMVTNRPETKVFKLKLDVLREALERYMAKNKFSVDTEKSGPLHVQTKWLEDGSHRTMLVADMKPLSKTKTEVKLQMFLEEKPMLRDKWKPTDEIGEDTYRRMLGDIEMECYRVLYDRS
jgi:hypothetical protein